jgi:hypothetical protein
MKYSQRTVFLPENLDSIIKETATQEKRSYTRQLETILESYFKNDEKYSGILDSNNHLC